LLHGIFGNRTINAIFFTKTIGVEIEKHR
jgi:hypothetical protein